MSAASKYRAWSEPQLAQLRRFFLEGDELIELMTKLQRTDADIIRTLIRQDLLIIKEHQYRRMHPTPFAPCPKSKALSS